MADYLALLSVPHTRVDWPVAGCGLLAPIFDADGTISAHLRVSYRIALVKSRELATWVSYQQAPTQRSSQRLAMQALSILNDGVDAMESDALAGARSANTE